MSHSPPTSSRPLSAASDATQTLFPSSTGKRSHNTKRFTDFGNDDIGINIISASEDGTMRSQHLLSDDDDDDDIDHSIDDDIVIDSNTRPSTDDAQLAAALHARLTSPLSRPKQQQQQQQQSAPSIGDIADEHEHQHEHEHEDRDQPAQEQREEIEDTDPDDTDAEEEASYQRVLEMPLARDRRTMMSYMTEASDIRLEREKAEFLEWRQLEEKRSEAFERVRLKQLERERIRADELKRDELMRKLMAEQGIDDLPARPASAAQTSFALAPSTIRPFTPQERLLPPLPPPTSPLPEVPLPPTPQNRLNADRLKAKGWVVTGDPAGNVPFASAIWLNHSANSSSQGHTSASTHTYNGTSYSSSSGHSGTTAVNHHHHHHHQQQQQQQYHQHPPPPPPSGPPPGSYHYQPSHGRLRTSSSSSGYNGPSAAANARHGYGSSRNRESLEASRHHIATPSPPRPSSASPTSPPPRPATPPSPVTFSAPHRRSTDPPPPVPEKPMPLPPASKPLPVHRKAIQKPPLPTAPVPTSLPASPPLTRSIPSSSPTPPAAPTPPPFLPPITPPAVAASVPVPSTSASTSSSSSSSSSAGTTHGTPVQKDLFHSALPPLPEEEARYKAIAAHARDEHRRLDEQVRASEVKAKERAEKEAIARAKWAKEQATRDRLDAWERSLLESKERKRREQVERLREEEKQRADAARQEAERQALAEQEALAEAARRRALAQEREARLRKEHELRRAGDEAALQRAEAREAARLKLKKRLEELELGKSMVLNGSITVQIGESLIWRRRWFELRGNSMLLYKSEHDKAEVLERIDLRGSILSISDAYEECQMVNSFKVTFVEDAPVRSITAYTDTPEDKDVLRSGIEVVSAMEL